MILTLKLRLKDKHRTWLNGQAREVNLTWNYCNELSQKILKREGRFVGQFELQKYTDGASKECSLHSHTIQAVGKEYVTRRAQFKRSRLAWRKSGGARRSLGWVPFKSGNVKYRAGQVFFNGRLLSLWDSYGLSNYVLRAGCFSEDSRGRWYLNVQVEVPAGRRKSESGKSVGIDLGLKEFATLSDGLKVEAHRFYRDLEPALAVAQRARKRQRVRALHAKIANRRKDALHKFSTTLAREYGAIFIGNVDAQKLTQTRMAKSVLDAGWSAFRTMLQYKSADAGVWFEEVDEAFTTQTCSCCDSRTGPKGIEGLGIRQWECNNCGTQHDRDVNAARNILKMGMKRAAGARPVMLAAYGDRGLIVSSVDNSCVFPPRSGSPSSLRPRLVEAMSLASAMRCGNWPGGNPMLSEFVSAGQCDDRCAAKAISGTVPSQSLQ